MQSLIISDLVFGQSCILPLMCLTVQWFNGQFSFVCCQDKSYERTMSYPFKQTFAQILLVVSISFISVPYSLSCCQSFVVKLNIFFMKNLSFKVEMRHKHSSSHGIGNWTKQVQIHMATLPSPLLWRWTSLSYKRSFPFIRLVYFPIVGLTGLRHCPHQLTWPVTCVLRNMKTVPGQILICYQGNPLTHLSLPNGFWSGRV